VTHEPGVLGGTPKIVLLRAPLSLEIAHDQWVEMHPLLTSLSMSYPST
jgi:hypothetical protein